MLNVETYIKTMNKQIIEKIIFRIRQMSTEEALFEITEESSLFDTTTKL